MSTKREESKAIGHAAALREIVEERLNEIKRLVEETVSVQNAADLEVLEKRVFEITDELGSQVIACKLQENLDSEALGKDASELMESSPKKLKNQRNQEFTIFTSRGKPILVKTVYYSEKARKRNKRRRTGFYPALLLLGIHDHCSPFFASQISTMSTVVGSLKEAQQVLKSWGIDLDVKTIRAITLRCAERARRVQMESSVDFAQSVSGFSVVVSTDGGRLRIRKDKRGQKSPKGRKRYSTNWREPKLLIIYVVNEKGEMLRQFSPFIDGTLKGPDAVFSLISFYLGRLEIKKAAKILFVADGARWIWNRTGKLAKSLGLNPGQFYELVDFYHAVEHLGAVASLRKSWSSRERKTWIRKQRKRLLEGDVEAVIDSVRQICKGRLSNGMRRERNYFIRNKNRMCYAQIADLGFPIGSGAIESAIRRVVNLRLKGASIFWHRATAEAMIFLRSFYKAGRWNLLKTWMFSSQHVALS